MVTTNQGARNLKLAENAIGFVKSLKIRAANRINDTNQSVKTCLSELRTAMRNYDRRAADADMNVEHSDIHERAARAASARCGNCGEQAAIVFSYLESRGVRPLDLMGPAGSTQILSSGNIDHAFVVIGRDKGSDPSDQKTWGLDAVVCDAWDGDKGSCYLASDIPVRFLRNSVQDAVGAYCSMSYPFSVIYRRD